MFKSLTYSWFKKPEPVTVDSSEIPSSFTMPSGDDDLFNISMKGQNDFIDIQYRKLTYAEAASLSKGKSQTNLNSKLSEPRQKRPDVNQFKVLNCEDDLDEFDVGKSDIHYKKSREFKSKQRGLLEERKRKKEERKKMMK